MTAMSELEPKDAVLSQANTIHHPTCSRVKRLKDPAKVTVLPEGYSWLVATLPTGAKHHCWASMCCGRHFRTKDATIRVWRDDE